MVLNRDFAGRHPKKGWEALYYIINFFSKYLLGSTACLCLDCQYRCRNCQWCHFHGLTNGWQLLAGQESIMASLPCVPGILSFINKDIKHQFFYDSVGLKFTTKMKSQAWNHGLESVADTRDGLWRLWSLAHIVWLELHTFLFLGPQTLYHHFYLTWKKIENCY